MKRIDHARTGLSFTELGLGTAPLGNLFRAVPDAEARALIDAAWEGGVRHFDTAPLYGLGLSETRLGAALRDRPRDDYVLATKVGRLLDDATEETRDGIGKWFDVPAKRERYDFTADGVRRSLDASLGRLGVERADILHGHDLDRRNQGPMLEARLREFLDGGVPALIGLREQGVIRAVGLGVNEWEPAQWLLERADLNVVLLAGRYTLLEQGARGFLDLCAERGVGVIVGGPYNSGLLAGGEHYDYGDVPPELAERTRTLRALVERHGARLVDAAFRFPLRHPSVVSVIPGSQTLAEMRDNLRAQAAVLPDALWADLPLP
jgi:D-threo-aldose 1-dehydrogenase